MEKESLNYQETTVDKLTSLLRKNIFNIIIVLICFIFVFRGLFSFTETGKTLKEIVADSFLSFCMGITLNSIFSKKGIQAAQNCPNYIALMNTYNAEIVKTDPNIDKLDDWCDLKTEKNLKLAQTKVLRKGRIKYEDFINNTKEEFCKTKEQLKYWKLAERVKVRRITADNLLSETSVRYEKGVKEYTLLEYEKSQGRKDVISKVLLALVFGYFTVSFSKDFGGILWGAIQISIWLGIALTKYISDYMYVKEVYSNVIRRKINALIEFNNSCKKGGDIDEHS